MKKIILIRKPGRLGNQLFQFSNLIAYSDSVGVNVQNPIFLDYSGFFEGTVDQSIIGYPLAGKGWKRFFSHSLQYRLYVPLRRILTSFSLRGFCLKYIDPSLAVSLEDTITPLVKGNCKTLYINSGWKLKASVEALLHSEATIRAYFRPINRITDGVEASLEVFRDSVDICIGVHIRWGDFRAEFDGRFYISRDTYLMYMKSLVSMFGSKRVRFVIFSDEPHEISDFPGFDVVVASSGIIEDLYGMSLCDLILIPFFTSFSRWASFYGEVPAMVVEKKYQSFSLGDFGIVNSHAELVSSTFSGGKLTDLQGEGGAQSLCSE